MELHLPAIPQRKQGEFLVVYLTSAEQSTKRKLEQLIDLAVGGVKRDKPLYAQHPVYVPASRHVSQLQKEKCDQVGTLSDLYKVGAESARKGWWMLLVVDGCTIRQLQGKPRHGEDGRVSVILIRTSLGNAFQEADGAENGDLVIEVGRPMVPTAVQCIICNNDNAYQESRDEYGRYENERHEDGNVYPWMKLYNPDLGPLSPDRLLSDRSSTIQASKTASLLRHILPLELVEYILEQANTDSPLESLTTAPKRLDLSKKTVLVLSLVPLTREESSRTGSMLRTAIRGQDMDMELTIYPWLASYAGRRRELFRLFQRTMDHPPHWRTHVFFLFLDKAAMAASPRVGVVYGHDQWSLCAQHITPDEVAGAWKNLCRPVVSLSTTPLLEEELREADRKYTEDLPLFVRTDGGYITSVFLLSKDLETATIETCEELIQDGISGEETVIIPWEQDEDGTEYDICRIVKEASRYCSPPIIFIDQQTVKDGTVIVAKIWEDDADPDSFYDYIFRGMQYGRIDPEDAGIMWVNLSIANMDWEDYLGDEETTYVPAP